MSAVEAAAADAAREHLTISDDGDKDAAYIAAVEASKPAHTPEYLHVIGECADPCGLAESEWHRGVKVWRCASCGFQTFNEDEALKRMSSH